MEKIRRSILMGGGKALLLGFALLVIALAATGCEQPDNNVADYITTADGTWEIYTADGLLAWNAYVMKNTGTPDTPEYPNLGTSAKLMADISLEGKSWTPVGYYGDNPWNGYSYAGTFDGGGHTISNLKIESSDSYSLGLFGYIATDGVVKNLALSDVEISGVFYIGGIVGYNRGTIENCHLLSGSVSGTYAVGGIVGYNDGTISTCNNKGKVSGTETEYVGGIAGRNDGTISACYNIGEISGTDSVGGIAGCNYGTIENCSVSGSVSGIFNVGGIAGFSYGTISACYNIGEILGYEEVGGIAGGNDYGLSDGIIISCYNTGNISGTSYVGGIAGYNYRTITACYWSVPEGSSITGIGDGSGSTTQVGENSVTWEAATSAMNDAISDWNKENSNKCDYQFVQNDGESEPPVLEKGAPATT